MKMLKLQTLCSCILLFPLTLICNASNLNSNSMTPEGIKFINKAGKPYVVINIYC